MALVLVLLGGSCLPPREEAPAAQRAGASILELRPADESLESVFSYLVRR